MVPWSQCSSGRAPVTAIISTGCIEMVVRASPTVGLNDQAAKVRTAARVMPDRMRIGVSFGVRKKLHFRVDRRVHAPPCLAVSLITKKIFLRFGLAQSHGIERQRNTARFKQVSQCTASLSGPPTAARAQGA